MQRKRTPGMPLKKKTGPTFLDSKLAALGYDTYARYLAGKHWQDTRKRFYADEHTPKACLCGATTDLDLHHTTYLRLGAELLEDLHPLCKRCHVDVHVLARRGLMDLKLQGYSSDLRRARYARERTARLRREGIPEENWPAESYDPVVWSLNAKLRWERETHGAETGREAARRHKRQFDAWSIHPDNRRA